MRSRARWWVAFAVGAVLVAAWSVLSGSFVVSLDQKEVVGESRIGEWVDFSEYGLRIRVDSLEFVDSVTVGLEGATRTAPEGFSYLLARYTIEALVTIEEGLGCRIELTNADGEHLLWTEPAAQGPIDHGCYAQSTWVGEIEAGDVFETQSYFIVEPAPVESFSLTVWPLLADGLVGWRITP